LRCTKPVTFAIWSAVSPSGFMLTKSSSAGACARRGMVNSGGATTGFGAGFTSGFLTAGSGNWADGGGFCSEGWGFCPGGVGVASVGGEGFCGVVCGFSGVELCCCDPGSDATGSDATGSDANLALREAVTSCPNAAQPGPAPESARPAKTANFTKYPIARSRPKAKRDTPSPSPAPRRGREQDTLFAARPNKKRAFVPNREKEPGSANRSA
jgi:hypothetical protein